ncbi:MAG: division/cell wall cluster transcriptional repressor MraZ [bacterium]
MISESSVPMREVYTDLFEHSFDEKGRLTVPSEWRSEAHEKRLHVMPSRDGCLKVYPVSYMSEALRRFNQAPVNDPRRKSLESLASSIQAVACDQQGRVMIKKNLREMASLGKEAVLVGKFDHFEIWSRKSWSSRPDATRSFEEIAEEIGL